jgi:2-C-methyl-D-erythritol 4-phosphate cytidylyltransferase / 2-C-methyl-D-erythritol 2,4-cyclodiphosphate synthase
MTMKPHARIAAIIVAAGSGSRIGGLPKQYREIAGKPMLRHSVEAFLAHPLVDVVVVVIGEGQQELAEAALVGLSGVEYVIGGAERRDSVRNALEYVENTYDIQISLIHDAARPFLSAKIIDTLVIAVSEANGAVPALPAVDSMSRADPTGAIVQSIDRNELYRIQTPQAFRHDVILDAHRRWDPTQIATDDASMALAFGHKVKIVAGDERLGKITFADDFTAQAAQERAMIDIRTGTGFDVHRLTPGEELWLCGIKIDHDKGLAGHSDADVALHAITDAVFGAAALGDIGEHFPPSDAQWRGASSDRFLAHAVSLAANNGFAISNVDLTLICEEPKIGPHKPAMRARIAQILAIAPDRVSVKATTTENLGFTGRGEGIAAQAAVTLIGQKP